MAGWQVLGVLLAAALVVLLAAQAEAQTPTFTCDRTVFDECKENCEVKRDCDDGSKHFNNTCFWVSRNSYPWSQAHRRCEARGNGWQLAKLHSQEEQVFLKDLNGHSRSMWIGLRQHNPPQGPFYWRDFSELGNTYKRWSEGQPDATERSWSCVFMDHETGEWDDTRCRDKHEYACSRPGARPVTPVTLSCKEEEMSKKCNELCKPICRADEHQFGEGTCFHVTPDYYNSADAQDKCRERGMELASLHSQKEQDFLIGSRNGDLEIMWIGLKHIKGGNESNWEWSDGTAYDWSSWGRSQPNDYKKPGEDCVYLDQYWREWYDEDCTVSTELYRAACKRTKSCGEGEHQYGGNTCFWFETEGLDWDAAQSRCKERGDGWELASIHSRQEFDFVLDVLRGAEFKRRDVWMNEIDVWFGLEHSSTKGARISLKPGCGTMNSASGQWDGRSCTDSYGFVCRGPAVPLP